MEENEALSHSVAVCEAQQGFFYTAGETAQLSSSLIF
jgi:hypothetical protein